MTIKITNKYCVVVALFSTYSPMIFGQENITTESTELDEIVITSEQLEKTLSESSTSAQIFDESRLVNEYALNTLAKTYQQTTNMNPVYGSGKAPSIRGIDGTGPAENANAFFAGSRPRLSVSVDNVSRSYNEIAFGDMGLFDVQQVEILRGPQSSLVGRNSVAGTVAVKSNDPIFEKEGKIRVSGGNNDNKQISGMVNLPVNDDMAVRLSVDWQQRNSSVNYDSFEGLSSPEKIQGLTLRGKFLYEPDENKKLLLTLDRNAHFAPNTEIVKRPFGERSAQYPKQPRHETKSTNLSLDYENKINDDFILSLNTSATDFKFIRTAQPNTSSGEVHAKRYTIEPQLHYSNDDYLQAVVGLYLHKNDQDEAIDFLGGQSFSDKSTTAAIYAETEIPLSENIDLNLGARYEIEKRKREGGDPTRAKVNISLDKSYQAFLPKIGVNWHPNDDTTWGITASKGYNAGGGGITFAFPIVNYEYEKETVWAYEIFGRQSFADERITTTQNIFVSQYKNMQLPFDLTPGNSRDESFVVRNADKVTTKGIELGINTIINDAWSARGNIAYLDTKVNSYPNSGIEGNALFNAPRLTANAGINWQHENWDVSFSGNYTSNYYTDINNREGGETSSYFTADADISYKFNKGDGKVFFGVNNLFDVRNPIARYPGLEPGTNNSNAIYDTAVYNQERTFVLGIEYGF